MSQPWGIRCVVNQMQEEQQELAEREQLVQGMELPQEQVQPLVVEGAEHMQDMVLVQQFVEVLRLGQQVVAVRPLSS